MDEKTLATLEYPKVLERLAGYASFSASAALARALTPARQLESARERLALTAEARLLLSVNAAVSIGGATDVRPLLAVARRSGVLAAGELLDIKTTLMSGRELYRIFEKQTQQLPLLSAIASPLQPPAGIIEAISRTISERGEILDSASPKLASIRAELKIAHDRLLSRLERMIADPKNAPVLQEPIITQRNGRYVIPLRADFKGRIRSIVHDQSASGATLFVEPLVVVEMNNRWHELQLEERDEERRILSELTDLIGQHADEINAIVDALARLDLALMCGKYAEDLRASAPILHPIKPPANIHHPGTVIKLYQARHPLLDPQTVVPIDVVLDDQTFAIVITGPNTGGKTVTLKTVGLLAAMAQSGLHIPVLSGSEISLFDNIFADIGDEQSIEQSLSTFSGHVTNIVRILSRAGSKSLVLLDELGAGTDPQEGAALARAILSYLLEKRIPCLIATHYPELKAFAHAAQGAVNASMEFDLDTLRPTFRLTIGLPGRSNALAIAERLGLNPQIIQTARAAINPSELHADDLLDEIYRQRELSRADRLAAERARQEAEKIRLDLKLRLESIESERQRLLQETSVQAESEIQELREELDELRKALARARQPIEALKPLQSRLAALEEKAARPIENALLESDLTARKLRVGERIRLRSLKMEGVLISLGINDAEVQVGNLRVRARLDDIQPRSEALAEAAQLSTASPNKRLSPIDTPPARKTSLYHASPGMELDLRGQRAEEALDALETYLDNAFLAGLPFVRIIHGKGTGKLRIVIREALRKSPHVARFETGKENEGGDGVTVAHLRTE